MVLLLSACASTPGGLKDDPAALRSFEVQAGYQTVLRRLVEHNAECSGAPLLPIGQVIFDVQNYTDLKVATITQGASGFGTQIYLVMEMTETSPGVTTVKLWSKGPADRIAKVAKRVADGGKGCAS